MLRVAARSTGLCSREGLCCALHSSACAQALSLEHPAVAIWSPNTDVGKTLLSAALAHSLRQAGVCIPVRWQGYDSLCLRQALRAKWHVHATPSMPITSLTNPVHRWCLRSLGAMARVLLQADVAYIKPVQTGYPADSDAGLVARVAHCSHTQGSHAQACVSQGASTTEAAAPSALEASQSANTATTLFAWSGAISPHLAVQREGRSVADAELCTSVEAAIAQGFAQFGTGKSKVPRGSMAIVETAGGVCSPGPSGRLQVWLKCTHKIVACKGEKQKRRKAYCMHAFSPDRCVHFC